VALSHATANPPRELLVGFVLPGPEVPPDGALVVVNGKPAGRVTSSRHSPSKRAVVGLAFVAPGNAEEGARIQIRLNEKLAQAAVTMEVFYDPAGARLRE
jgi:dimethylglycine dehydrogenase